MINFQFHKTATIIFSSWEHPTELFLKRDRFRTFNDDLYSIRFLIIKMNRQIRRDSPVKQRDVFLNRVHYKNPSEELNQKKQKKQRPSRHLSWLFLNSSDLLMQSLFDNCIFHLDGINKNGSKFTSRENV